MISEAGGNPYLPGGEAGGAHEVSAWLYLHVLVVLRTDLTQLEGGAHLTVELVLFLRVGDTHTHKGFQYLHTEQHHTWTQFEKPL